MSTERLGLSTQMKTIINFINQLNFIIYRGDSNSSTNSLPEVHI